MDRDVFDEDCRRFMASQANVGRVGVDGGELELRRDANGMVSVGGRPTNLDLETTREGKYLREKLRDHINSQDCHRPASNWFRANNRALDK